MTPQNLAKILDEILTPLMDEVASVKTAFSEITQKMDGNKELTKNELKTFVIERASEERDRLLRDRDAFRGERGERGKPGEKGIRGDIGQRGEKGIQGDRGIQGERGLVGGRGERGEKGIQGVIGKNGRDGLPGEKGQRGDVGGIGKQGTQGERGETGFIKAVEAWRKREYDAGEIVSNNGATWQSRRKTSHEPDYLSNSWELIANGLSDVDFDGRKIKLTAADGETRTSPDLKGDKGDTGDVPYISGPYDAKCDYAQHEGVQQDGSLWYPAKGKSGKLGKPGKSPDWRLSAARGKTGPAGKSADPEVVKELVMLDIASENKAIIEMTLKQVDEYLEGVSFV